MIRDYIKAFEEWCKLKIALWRKESTVIFKQGDIWWCSLGMNLGEEIFGKGVRSTSRVAALDDADFKKVKERFLEFYST